MGITRSTIVILVFVALRLKAQVPAADLLNWNDRWNNYVAGTVNLRAIGMVAAETAFDQTFQLNKCGRPPYCFPSDFGGALARRSARKTVELGVGALLHEDLRRSPSNLTGLRQRTIYALIHAPLAKSPNGDWRPAYSRFAGTLSGDVVSSAWRGRPINSSRLFENFGWSITSYFQDALWTEFEPDLRRVARRFGERFHRHDRDAQLSPPEAKSSTGETDSGVALRP